MKAAETMWLRSIDKHKLRYSTMLSDGDSKAHKKVDGNPYAVSKEECVNHVHKRLTSCSNKGTQNANECLHNTLWSLCSKVYIYIYKMHCK